MRRPGFLIGGGRRAGIWRPVAGAVLMALALAACQTGGGSGGGSGGAATEAGNPPATSTRPAPDQAAPDQAILNRAMATRQRNAPSTSSSGRIDRETAARARELLKRAGQARKRKDYFRAMALLEEMEALTGETDISLITRGAVWVLLKRPDKSLPLYRKVEARLSRIGHEELVGHVYAGLGASLAMFTDIPPALDYLSRAAEIFRRHDNAMEREVRQNLARAEKLRGAPRPIPETPGYRENPVARQLAYKALEAMMQGQDDHADQLLKRAFVMDPYSRSVNYENGLVLAARKNHIQAETMLNRTLYIALQDGDVRYQGLALDAMAGIHLSQKNYRGAVQRYRDALPLLKQAGETTKVQRTEQSLREAEQKLFMERPQTPSRAAPVSRLPSTLRLRPLSSRETEKLTDGVAKALRVRDYRQAEMLQRQVTERAKKVAVHWNNLGWILTARGRLQDAMRAHTHAKRIAAGKADWAIATAEQGRLHILLGDVAEGRRLINAGIYAMDEYGMHEIRALFHEFLAIHYDVAGDERNALGHARSAMLENDKDWGAGGVVFARFLAGSLLLPQKKYFEGMHALNDVLAYGTREQHGDRIPVAHALLGIANQQLGNMQAACGHFREYRRAPPGRPLLAGDQVQEFWTRLGCPARFDTAASPRGQTR